MSSKVLFSTAAASAILIHFTVGWVFASGGIQKLLFLAALGVACTDFWMVGLIFLLIVGALGLSPDFTLQRATAR